MPSTAGTHTDEGAVMCSNVEDQNRRGAPLLTSIPQFQKMLIHYSAPVYIPGILEWIVVPPVDLFTQVRFNSQRVSLLRNSYACLKTKNARVVFVKKT